MVDVFSFVVSLVNAFTVGTLVAALTVDHVDGRRRSKTLTWLLVANIAVGIMNAVFVVKALAK